MATQDFVGREVVFGPTEVTADAIVSFCTGINEEGDSFNEPDNVEFRAHPFHCVTSIIPASGMSLMHPAAEVNFQKIVHAGIEINFHEAIRSGDQVSSTAVLETIEEKANGRLLGFGFSTKNAEGTLLAEGRTLYYERGDAPKGEQGEAEIEDEETATVLMVKEFDTLPNQSILYAEGSGDRFPIHTSDEFARSVGLPGMILHGLCTLALSTRPVVNRSAKGDWGKLKSVSCRFSKIAVPGERLRIIAYRNYGGSVDFETYNMSGSTVITDGCAAFHGN
jgi:acyl dehydratase